MATLSFLSRRIFTRRFHGRFIELRLFSILLLGRTAIFFEHTPCFFRVLFADQYPDRSHRQHLCVLRLAEFGIDAGRLKQSAHNHRLGFLFGFKHSY